MTPSSSSSDICFHLVKRWRLDQLPPSLPPSPQPSTGNSMDRSSSSSSSSSNHGGSAHPYTHGYPPPGSSPPYAYPPTADPSQLTQYPYPYPHPTAYPPSTPNFPPPPTPQPGGSLHHDAYPYSKVDPSYPYAPRIDHLASIELSNQNPPAHAVGGWQHGGESMPGVALRPPNASQRVLLLHGHLDIWVLEARNLPNMDTFSKFVRDALALLCAASDAHTTSDPYVSISVADAVLGRTYVIGNSENPVWSQHFHLPDAHHAAEVRFLVKDSDFVVSELIGTVSIPAEQIGAGAKVQGTYPILGDSGKPRAPGATLRLSIQYIPVGGSVTHGASGGVPGTYFPVREGGRVTLYQDADVPGGSLPAVELEGGEAFGHGRCWRDVFEAIRLARRLVYVTGWSVYHEVRLVRDGGGGHGGWDATLGTCSRPRRRKGSGCCCSCGTSAGPRASLVTRW